MKRSRATCRRGAAMVEFALVLPVFLLIVFGIIEIGRGVMVQQIITNGAREGARRAVVPGATDAKVEQVLDNYLSGTSVSGFTRTISPSLSDAKPGDPITISISVPYSEVSWGILNWLNGATLRADVVMRKE